MTPDQAKSFLTSLGVKNSTLKVDGKWVRCACPLAPWLHQSGKDSHPSFALSVDETERAFFHCFTCESGSAEELLQAMELYTRDNEQLRALMNFKAARQLLDEDIPTMVTATEYQEGGVHDFKKTFVEWPEAYLQSFMPAHKVPIAADYLFGSKESFNEFGQRRRGITEAQSIAFDLRYDSSKGMVVFPFRNVFGRLAGMRGRSIVEKRHYDYTWNNVNNSGLVWFNEEKLDNHSGWVVVVEGQFDALRISPVFPKVLANLTAKPTEFKLTKLLHAEGTLFIPDNDDTGEISIQRYQEFHKGKGQPFKVLKLPNGIKDADECSSDWLRDRILEML